MTYHHRRGSELLSATRTPPFSTTRRVGNYLEPFDGRPLGLVRLYGLRLLHKELGHSLAQRTTVSPKRPAPRGPLKFEASFHACLPHNCPARITSSPACPSHKSPSNIVRLKRDFDTDVFESMLIEYTDGRTARRLFPKLFFPPNVWLYYNCRFTGLLSLSVLAPKFFFFLFFYLQENGSRLSQSEDIFPCHNDSVTTFKRLIENSISILYFAVSNS